MSKNAWILLFISEQGCILLQEHQARANIITVKRYTYQREDRTHCTLFFAKYDWWRQRAVVKQTIQAVNGVGHRRSNCQLYSLRLKMYTYCMCMHQRGHSCMIMCLSIHSVYVCVHSLQENKKPLSQCGLTLVAQTHTQPLLYSACLT